MRIRNEDQAMTEKELEDLVIEALYDVSLKEEREVNKRINGAEELLAACSEIQNLDDQSRYPLVQEQIDMLRRLCNMSLRSNVPSAVEAVVRGGRLPAVLNFILNAVLCPKIKPNQVRPLLERWSA